MAIFEIGTQVEMTALHKAQLIRNSCQEHVSEFGNEIGVITEIIDGVATVEWQVEPKPLKYHYLLTSLKNIRAP